MDVDLQGTKTTHERLLVLHTRSAHDMLCTPALHIPLSEITGTFLSFTPIFERNPG